jgi:hypothetical protein
VEWLEIALLGSIGNASFSHATSALLRAMSVYEATNKALKIVPDVISGSFLNHSRLQI